MSAKTKIVVFKMKELIYTAIFVGLAILLVVLFLAMFRQKSDKDDSAGKDKSHTAQDIDVSASDISAAAASYIPGVYTASLPLSSQSLDIEVIVDHNGIRHIRLINLEESVATMYPLMEPALDSLKEQILTNQSLEGVTYQDTSKYTSYILLQAIDSALKKATQ